jgi:CrcB protein
VNQLLLIGAGGAAGAIGRYWMSSMVYAVTGREFPWGTLVVNVIGSLLMGFLSVWLLERMTTNIELRSLLLIGFLGAFTTFSTFSLETLTLLEQGAILRAGINTLASVIVCVSAAWLGVYLARTI